MKEDSLTFRRIIEIQLLKEGFSYETIKLADESEIMEWHAVLEEMNERSKRHG